MQRGHIVLARDAEPLHEPEEHEMESPDVVLVPLAEVASLIRSGKICAAASVAGLLLILERVG
jgi:hypothetical protein